MYVCAYVCGACDAYKCVYVSACARIRAWRYAIYAACMREFNNVYIYIYIYVYIYISAHVCGIYTCVDACIYIYIYIYICVCVRLFMYLFIYLNIWFIC